MDAALRRPAQFAAQTKPKVLSGSATIRSEVYTQLLAQAIPNPRLVADVPGSAGIGFKFEAQGAGGDAQIFHIIDMRRSPDCSEELGVGDDPARVLG